MTFRAAANAAEDGPLCQSLILTARATTGACHSKETR